MRQQRPSSSIARAALTFAYLAMGDWLRGVLVVALLAVVTVTAGGEMAAF